LEMLFVTIYFLLIERELRLLVEVPLLGMPHKGYPFVIMSMPEFSPYKFTTRLTLMGHTKPCNILFYKKVTSKAATPHD